MKDFKAGRVLLRNLLLLPLADVVSDLMLEQETDCDNRVTDTGGVVSGRGKAVEQC